MKKRLLSQDFVRASCAVCMVIYHFGMHLPNRGTTLMTRTANGLWGDIFVTLFFAMSGAMLWENNPRPLELKKFYYKRWKSIFPAFYLAYFPCFVANVIRFRSFFYLGHPASMLLTAAGLDGYFAYKTITYYILGEWFLGAIILLYLLFPLLNKLVEKNAPLVTVFLILAYALMRKAAFFEIDEFRNLISCLVSFECGMVMMKYDLFRVRRVRLLCLIATGILLAVPLPGSWYVYCHVTGLTLYVVLNWMGEYVMRNGKLSKAVSHISNISYPIFLVHHVIILKYIPAVTSLELSVITWWLLSTLVMTLFFAELLSVVTSAFIRTIEK